MPAQYTAIRDDLIRRGYASGEAKHIAAATYNKNRGLGANPATGDMEALASPKAPKAPGSARALSRSPVASARMMGQRGAEMSAQRSPKTPYAPAANPASPPSPRNRIA